MNILILVPSEDYKGNAGARIRYGRLAPSMEDHGASIRLEDISHFDARSADCDVLLISKCHDSRALIAAEVVSRRGGLVGADLFDDYFSQRADSRLARYRSWLEQMLPRCNFVTCSTEAMRIVVTSYAPRVPVHVINDPAPSFDEAFLRDALAEKLSTALSGGQIRLGWFGIGDNPNFPVGISDLAAFSSVIARLASKGPGLELEVLTNERALDAERLAMIARLPVRTIIGKWSERAEAELLARCFACFLPVRTQAFSTAKSLNRAVTALASGCQILSVGYPLYASLNEFIYREADDLIRDFSLGAMRLSPSSVGRLRELLDVTASPAKEAADFVSFLNGLRVEKAPESALPVYLVHGRASNGAAHKMVQAIGGLSVGTPFSNASLEYDVIFEARRGGGLAMLLSDKALSRATNEVRSRALSRAKRGNCNFWEIQDLSVEPEPAGEMAMPLELALYKSMMERVQASLETGLGPGRTIVSETSPLPFLAL